jgi:hypothetical protein
LKWRKRGPWGWFYRTSRDRAAGLMEVGVPRMFGRERCREKALDPGRPDVGKSAGRRLC